MNPELRTAVEEAVNVVNTHSGQTSVHLRFADEPGGIDFVANGARLHGSVFEFEAGFETYGGLVDELSEIRAEVIPH